MIYLISYLAVGVLMSILYFEEIESSQITTSVEGFDDISLPSRLFCSIVVLPFCLISMGTIVAVVHIDKFIKGFVK